ncbi:hypothetical protein PR048_025586 [Dryococelus australis]|uniref:Uncharacterized protein n=1 Tax=Dryococelus australis TaxID=614101 RepID=A0ABQ9GRP1_9NEOP|nr:hypothetical protein PR048_025586 [Dryococelus australis]
MLIELLVEKTARRIEASTATGNTDGSIVRCGLNKVTSHSSVVVTGEDVDLLVLLTALAPPDRNEAWKRNHQGQVSQGVTQHVRYSTKATDDIYEPTSTPDAVAQAGEHMFLTMYHTPPSERDLNNHRYNSFAKSSTKVKANLALLSSTKGEVK